MKRVIDLETWNRREHFELFRKYDVPFWSVSANVDVTQAYRWCKEQGRSFAVAYHWASAKAMNEIDALKMRIENDAPVLFDTIHVSSTVARPDGTFGFSFIPFDPDFEAFHEAWRLETERVKAESGLKSPYGGIDVTYYTVLRKVKFTMMEHAHGLGDGGAIPFLTFGETFEENGRMSKVGFLHKVNFNLLWRMVLPFRAYIESQANVVLFDDAGRFPFDALTEVLAAPNDRTPVDLYDTFYFVDEMSGEKMFEELYREALDAGMDFTGYVSLTSYDLAALMWLQNSELLQRLHAGMHVTKARRFEAFLGQSTGRAPDLSKEAIAGLEHALNDYFSGVRKGQGVRVFVFQKDGITWLMIIKYTFR